jgi:GT2 family glycosyltransferase
VADWAFIVLSWNGREDTLRCLAALAKIEGEHAVYLADNGSHDGTIAAVRDEYPDAVIVDNAANLGFSAGNNRAISRALDDGAAWVVLVNNDAEPEPGTLLALRDAARRNPDAGVLAGKLLFPDGRVQWAGQRVGLRSGYSGRPDGYGKPDGPQWSVDRPVDRAVGALMAVSAEAIAAAGLLDEDLFAYVEDVDWSLRIREAGFGCYFVAGARAVHALSAATGGDAGSTHTLYYGTRNTIVVLERHAPFGRTGTLLRRASIAASFALRALLVQRTLAALRAVAEGVNDARRGHLGPRAG